MPDPRSVMQEFRTLDAKRLAKGLSPEEERRHAELRDLVGGEAGAGAPRPGFDVNAAAEKLRESLLPAGLRNRPPPPPQRSPEPEPEPFFPAPAAPPELAFDAAPPPALEATPLEEGAPAEDLFDPALLGWEGEAGEALPQDPTSTGALDPNLPWDPNAAQAWDPSALPQGEGGWDPNAAADPASQPWDPAALPLDADGQPWDPAALPLDAGGQPWDPNAAAADPAAQAWDPNAAPVDSAAWDPNAAGWDPAAGAYDATGAAGWDPAALANPAAAGPWDPAAYPAEAAPIETPLLAEPGGAFDPAALLAEEAGRAAPAAAELEPWEPALAPDAPEPEPEPTIALALDLDASALEPGAAQPEPALDLDDSPIELEPLDDASLALAEAPDGLAGLDPSVLEGTASPEPTQILGLAAEPEPTLSMPLAGDAAQLPPAGWDPTPAAEAAPEGAPFGAYDELASGAAPAFGDGTDTLSAEDAGLDPALDPSAPPPVFAPAADELGGEYDDSAGFDAAAALGSPSRGGFEAGPPLALASGGAGDWHPEGALEEGFALASGGSFDAHDPAAGWATAEAPAPWESAPAPAGAAAPAPETDDPVTESHPLAAVPSGDDVALPEIVEEIPTIDGVEILEEIPPDEADTPPPSLDFGALPPAAAPKAPAPLPRTPAAVAPPPMAAPPAPPVAPATTSRAAGAHRVVVHTLEGTVKRGVIEDADLAAPLFALATAPGEAAEQVATEKVKAIFFMLAPGEAPPAAEGKKVRVTFRDGRQVAGYAPAYREDGPGFFMIPEDARTNTARIWVYRAAVKQVLLS